MVAAQTCKGASLEAIDDLELNISQLLLLLILLRIFF